MEHGNSSCQARVQGKMTDHSNSMLDAKVHTAADTKFIEAYKASAGRRRELVLLTRTSDLFLDDLLTRDITQNLRKCVVREQERRKHGGRAKGGLLDMLRRLLPGS
jgi:hypothetical protein